MDRHAAARANVAVGSFVTGSNRQQVWPCPLLRRNRKQIQSVRDSAANHYLLIVLPEP